MNYWDQLRNYLQQKVTAEGFDNWLKGTTLVGQESDTLYVSVPDRETRAWLETEYSGLILSGIAELALPLRRVCYETVAPRASQTMTPAVNGGPSEADVSSSVLNPKFTFDSFVVGACNHFAHAAAKSVATNPSRSYNPLFLYGGVGMGKTHLMHAIGRELIERHGAMRIIYTSSERFMNDMISCIRTERMRQLIYRYREADVLLVDDIQLLGNKERTQEEFFHTFNELHDHQRQIVISSDSPPKDIPGLLERLRSRFEWGLLADIQIGGVLSHLQRVARPSEADRDFQRFAAQGHPGTAGAAALAVRMGTAGGYTDRRSSFTPSTSCTTIRGRS